MSQKQPLINSVLVVNAGTKDSLVRMNEAAFLIMNNPDLHEAFIQGTSDLMMMSIMDPTEGEEREALLPREDSEEFKKIRRIGEDINAKAEALKEGSGLYVLMTALEVLRFTLSHKEDVRMLEFAWDGIGEFRA